MSERLVPFAELPVVPPVVPKSCPRCSCTRYVVDWKDPEAEVLNDVPIVYKGRRVWGDFECFLCGELLACWTRYARLVRSALQTAAARAQRSNRGRPRKAVA